MRCSGGFCDVGENELLPCELKGLPSALVVRLLAARFDLGAQCALRGLIERKIPHQRDRREF